MARDVIGGDAIFDWTVWWEAARVCLTSGALPGKRPDFAEWNRRRVERGDSDRWIYDEESARIDAEDYALALSRLGWCLRDVGALCAAHAEAQVSFAAGLPRRWWPGCQRPMPGWPPAG